MEHCHKHGPYSVLCSNCDLEAVMKEEEKKFIKPFDVSNSAVRVDASLLVPMYIYIPSEFTNFFNRDNAYIRFQNKWFFAGLTQDEVDALVAKEGIDKMKAMAHLNAVQRSFVLKHEHKVAAVAYLASLWFEPPEHIKQ